jgi:glyoxylase-like metal-dependent hydrolase (beta-lactamase superfamily II)
MAAALPVVTFGLDVTLHLNADELHVLHVPRAHTDGDAIVRFRNANVVHMGDTFFAGRYPFIDLDGGAGLAAYRDVLVLARDRVGAAIEAGRSMEQAVADRPLAELDARWGAGSIEPEGFLGTVYASLSAGS